VLALFGANVGHLDLQLTENWESDRRSARPPPEAQLSLNGLLVLGIIDPLGGQTAGETAPRSPLELEWSACVGDHGSIKGECPCGTQSQDIKVASLLGPVVTKGSCWLLDNGADECPNGSAPERRKVSLVGRQ
jgi:hypothetical protein